MSEWISQLITDTMQLIQSIDPFFSYSMLAVASFIENIFPPAPGDVITVFGASLVGTGHLDFIWVLFSTTLGSVAGFMAYFFLGRRLGKRFFMAKDYAFLPKDAFAKTELWFSKYGYSIVIANRFLSGLRSVISLFCGISQLNVGKVLIYSTISALLWNTILIYLGSILGQNWDLVKSYLSQYGQIVVSLMILTGIVFFIRKRFKNRSKVNS